MSLNILLVDDAKNYLTALHGLLHDDEGHGVDCVMSGEEAIEKVKVSEYHVIFMDYSMGAGRLNGIEATRRIRGLGVKTPIFIVSAETFPEEPLEGTGVDGYIEKTSTRLADRLLAVLAEYEKE